MKLETPIVIFSRSNFSLSEWVIRLVQGWTPYSHVAICFYSEDADEFMVFESSYGMVHCSPYVQWAEKNKVINAVNLSVSSHMYDIYLKKAYSYLGKKYDFKALIPTGLRLLGFPIKRKDNSQQMTCSEFVANIIANRLPFKGGDYVAPKDIYKVLIC